MLKKTCYLIFLVFASLNLLADGPPIDTAGNITCNFISIQLDKAQIKHLETHRWIKLNPAQQQRLHFLNLPKYVGVIDPFHRDCTCGQVYGMWYSPDKLAFCYNDTTKTEIIDEPELIEHYNNDTIFTRNNNPNDFYISTGGQLLYKGKPISMSRFQKITESIMKGEDNRFIFIYQPPMSNNKNADLVLKTKDKVRKALPKGMETIYWL